MHCSLACPVGVEVHPHGVAQPAYVGNGGSPTGGRLCYRGHYVSALMMHPKRLAEPQHAIGEGFEGGDLIAEASERIHRAGADDSLGVLLSGNRPTTELLAAGKYFSSITTRSHVSVYVPPSDRAILGGTADCAALGGWEDVARAQAILAVGDVLGTHPVLAKPVMDCLAQGRRASVVNVDSMVGRTMRFATVPLRVDRYLEVQAVLALLGMAGGKLKTLVANPPSVDELLGQCGVSADDAKKAVDALRDDDDAVVLLTIAAGSGLQGGLLARATAALAKATDSKLLPLHHYAGTPGSGAVSDALGLAAFSDWLGRARDGGFSCLFLADMDLFGCLPDEWANSILGSDRLDGVIAAAPMPNATTQQADITLPLAFWFEVGGQILDHRGEVIELAALNEPPGAALGLVDLINGLTQSQGTSGVEAGGVHLNELAAGETNSMAGDPVMLAGATPEHSYSVMPRSETVDLMDGGLSRQLDWPLSVEPQPVVLINPRDAKKLGVCDQETVRLSRDGVVCVATARISAAVSEGTVAAPSSIPETKDLFAWELSVDGVNVSGVPVEIDAPVGTGAVQ